MFGRFMRRAASPLVALLVLLSIAAPLGSPVVAQTPAPTEGTQAQIAGDPLTPGTTAIVHTLDGSCLRLRDQSTLAGSVITCVPNRQTVLVLPATTEADGYRWQLVEWRGQSGWAADEFLDPYTGPPIANSCQPSTMKPGITGQVPQNGAPESPPVVSPLWSNRRALLFVSVSTTAMPSSYEGRSALAIIDG